MRRDVNGLSFRFLLLLGAGILLPLGGLLGWSWLTLDLRESPTRWELKEVSDGGRTLVIRYSTNTCEELERVERGETATTVSLTVVVDWPHGSCDDIAIYHTTEVDLDRPLGVRKLVDGRTGRGPERFSLGAVQPPMYDISTLGRSAVSAERSSE